MQTFAFLNVTEPWIAWLVARRIVVSAQSVHNRALSVWHAKYLRDAAGIRALQQYFDAEQRLELIRAESCATAVPRLTGLYMFPTLEAARSAGLRWDGHFSEEFLTELELLDAPTVSRYDSDFITHDLLSPDNSWMARYWRGDARSATPTWEILVEGRARVLNEPLRRRAFDRVAEVWPQSVSLLHLAQAAAELGSDLGVIVPMIFARNGRIDLEFTMNFEDATNPAFLERLRGYAGAADLSLLARSDHFNTPDFTPYAVSFPHSA